ncbi:MULTISPECIES: HAD family hydrolase [Cohaesibacter]|uniref:HAD family hydrolase n=1 Tax=Cohaesibacter TaxID=655352 RepID=UPI0013001CDA|nr:MULTISPECIES: HAD family phosphatase [Cohaesibacter]
MSRFEAVIFDFDGVIVDSETISLDELQRSMAMFGIEKSWNELVEGFLGHSNASTRAYIEKTAGRDAGDEFPNLWNERILARFTTDLALMPGTLSLFDHLEAEGIRYCIATGSSEGRLQHALDVVGIGHRFEDRLYSTDRVANGKPAPDIFLHALEALGADPARTAVIEDGIAGTIGARAAGIEAVFGFVGGTHLRECVDWQAGKLSEAGALQVTKDLSDFEAILRA